MNIHKRKRTVKWIGGKPFVTVNGNSTTPQKLLGQGDKNTKTRKSLGYGWETAGLSLAPANSGGMGNVCGRNTDGCTEACLHYTGMASVWNSIHEGRIRRTVLWKKERQWFLDTLIKEIRLDSLKAMKNESRFCVRLNIFSDIPWEKYGIPDEFMTVQFYDYTKWPNRSGQIRPNYYVTFSKSETNTNDCQIVLCMHQANVAMVFDVGAGSVEVAKNGKENYPLPKTWNGHKVIDGDESDLRFLDDKGVVVGLRLKSHSESMRQKAINSGFAVTT